MTHSRHSEIVFWMTFPEIIKILKEKKNSLIIFASLNSGFEIVLFGKGIKVEIFKVDKCLGVGHICRLDCSAKKVDKNDKILP